MKRAIVLSLGGSMIVPEKIDFSYLERFKEALQKNYKTHKFIVVCGGGVIARKYISVLKKSRKTQKALNLAGIRATRMNARFIMQFFGEKEANDTLPMSMNDVRNALKKNNVVICGALRYTANSTTDGTAANLAHFLKTDFINLTNVKGLYDKNPRKYKNAKLIQQISWKEFNKRINKIKFKAGQNFPLDQNASHIIKKHKINTYIIHDPENIIKIIKGKNFEGTLIANNKS